MTRAPKKLAGWQLRNSEGRALLLDVLHRTTREFVAARCDVARPTVNGWCAGHKRPGARARNRLLWNYEIPIDAWDRPTERKT